MIEGKKESNAYRTIFRGLNKNIFECGKEITRIKQKTMNMEGIFNG